MSTWAPWVKQVEVGEHICHVRPLSVHATEHMIVLRDKLVAEETDPRFVGTQLTSTATYFGLCDETGASLFDPDTPEMARDIPFPLAQACGEVILEISGLDITEETEAEKPRAVHSVG